MTLFIISLSELKVDDGSDEHKNAYRSCSLLCRLIIQWCDSHLIAWAADITYQHRHEVSQRSRIVRRLPPQNAESCTSSCYLEWVIMMKKWSRGRYWWRPFPWKVPFEFKLRWIVKNTRGLGLSEPCHQLLKIWSPICICDATSILDPGAEF